MTIHVAWTEIENFYTVRKTLSKYPELLGPDPVVKYKAKVKLHGTNAAVKIDHDGWVSVMSRSAVITPEADNVGFAKFVEEREAQFRKLGPGSGSILITGEWFGPRIQKGVACSQVKERQFAVFAIRLFNEFGEETLFFDEPDCSPMLALSEIDRVHVIPWFNDGEEFVVDWPADAQTLQTVTDKINECVLGVEQCDPWIAQRFGVEGTGEGLVFYPRPTPSYRVFSKLCFKAKGDKHKTIARVKPAQAEPEIAASAAAFAEMVVTEVRLEQFARVIGEGELVFDLKNTGKFIVALLADVAKETKVELEASGLDEKIAMKSCSKRAQKWYVTKAKSL